MVYAFIGGLCAGVVIGGMLMAVLSVSKRTRREGEEQ